MFKNLLSFFLLLNLAWAQKAKVLKIEGSDASIERSSKQSKLTKSHRLQMGDTINCLSSLVEFKTPHLLVAALPAAKVKILLLKDAESIELLKGKLAVQGRYLKKEAGLSVISDGVTFSWTDAKFDIATSDQKIDVKVLSGQVTVSSPDIHTFVPEVVKANDLWSFDRHQRTFGRGQK